MRRQCYDAEWVNVTYQVGLRARILYNEGQPGYAGVEMIALAVDVQGMTVQFDDRADTTYIPFSASQWMDFISVVE